MASLTSLLLLLLSLPFIPAQPTAAIKAGSFLLAGDDSSPPWRSPSGDFAFGFHKLAGDTFLLAVWFFTSPESSPSPVWYAKTNNDPVFAEQGSKLEVLLVRGLVLQNAQGREIWRSEVSSGAVAGALMKDSGNFVLVDSDSNPLWESFRLPTDTLLPTQEMLIFEALSSRKSNNSFLHGRFQFRLLEEGNAVLNSVNFPTNFPYDPYYDSKTNVDKNMFLSGYKVVFDESGFLYVLKRNGERVNITLPASFCSPETHYFKATLHYDGVLAVSCRPKSSAAAAAINGGWKDVAWVPENICMAARGTLGTGACGYNSLCKLKPDRRPSCSCPPGYSLIDSEDEYGSCKPNVVQSCDGGAYGMTELANTDWPMLDYELYSPFAIEDCKKACMEDCLCVVSVYRDGNCWKKKLPLSNGRTDPSESSVSFLKLSQKATP